MIYERSIFVFAWIILSSLVASGSSTTESKNLKRNFVTNRDIILSSANTIHAQNKILTNAHAQRESAVLRERTYPHLSPLRRFPRRKRSGFLTMFHAAPLKELSRAGVSLMSNFRQKTPSFYGGIRVTGEGVYLSGEEWMAEYGQTAHLQIAAPVLNEQKILYLSSTKPTLTVVQAVQDPSAKIEQRLAVVGIGVTSIVFLILLWFLFKSEPKNIAKVTSLDKQDSLDRSNKIDNSYEMVDESELAAIKLLSSAKINLAQESPNSIGLEKSLSVSENSEISFDTDIIQPDQDLAKD